MVNPKQVVTIMVAIAVLLAIPVRADYFNVIESYRSTDPTNDYGQAIDIDSQGNLVLAGFNHHTPGDWDIYLSQYSDQLQHKWTVQDTACPCGKPA
ncbi:MAG: hypothetical protein GX448_11870 [Planctomycetes bacterium]|nr:hypothetical protein [Planctomycetota bacterium]